MSKKRQYGAHQFVIPPPPQTSKGVSNLSSFLASPTTPAPPGGDAYPAMTPLPLAVDTTSMPMEPLELVSGAKIAAPRSLRRRLARFVSPAIAILLISAVAYVWFAPTSSTSTSPSSITQQTFSNSSSPGTSGGSSGGDIHVYVVGAVRHPGVYDLPAGARVYQLIQAAGGALPTANLVALNMAAALTDGQEVYVVSDGEIPPTYQGGVPGVDSGGGNGTPAASGQLININTASADQMRSALHVSSATAQKIIDYRTQNGPYTSVDQLLNAVSKEIYDKIKNEVTV